MRRGPGRSLETGSPPLRETVSLYGVIALLAVWASFGPKAGLYTLLYETIPVFSFLRAASRMGVILALALAVFSAIAVRAMRENAGARWKQIVGLGVCAVALIDLWQAPFDWRPADPIPAVYRVLARMPRGPLAEFPFYGRRSAYHIHTRYMLNSTVHWQPLVNGYSDHIPSDFRTLAPRLATFPSREAFDAMRERRVRYIAVHYNRYDSHSAKDVAQRLERFKDYLKPLAQGEGLELYEVVGFPQ
jgi:hypothetical protein